MLGKYSTSTISEARQVVMKLAHDTNKVSQNYIARFFKRNHATVDHGRKRVSDLYDSDKYFRNKIDNLKEIMKSKDQMIHNWETFNSVKNQL